MRDTISSDAASNTNNGPDTGLCKNTGRVPKGLLVSAAPSSRKSWLLVGTAVVWDPPPNTTSGLDTVLRADSLLRNSMNDFLSSVVAHLGWQVINGEACLLEAAGLRMMQLCKMRRPTGQGAGQLGMSRVDRRWHSNDERIRVCQAPGFRSMLANLAQQQASSNDKALSSSMGRCCAAMNSYMRSQGQSLGNRRRRCTRPQARRSERAQAVACSESS